MAKLYLFLAFSYLSTYIIILLCYIIPITAPQKKENNFYTVSSIHE